MDTENKEQLNNEEQLNNKEQVNDEEQLNNEKQVEDKRRNRTKAKRMKKYQMKLNKQIKYSSIILLVIAAVFCGYQSYKHYIAIEVEEQEHIQYSYSLEQKADYKVQMRANELYPTEMLLSGGVYITQLINSLMTDFETIFKASEVSNIAGTYRIDTEVVSYTVEDDIKKDIWCKRIPLVELKRFNEQTDVYHIQEHVEVDYATQRAFVESVEEALEMRLPVEMRIHLVGNIRIDTPYEAYQHPLNMKVIAPLTEEYIEVTVEGVDRLQDELKVIDTITLPKDMRPAIFYGSIAVTLLIGSILVGVLTREATEKERYEAHVRKIFTEYGSRIVEVDVLDMNNYEIQYQLTTIDDLIKVADELERPITYHAKDVDTLQNNFYVVHEKTLYCYSLEMSIMSSIPIQSTYQDVPSGVAADAKEML